MTDWHPCAPPQQHRLPSGAIDSASGIMRDGEWVCAVCGATLSVQGGRVIQWPPAAVPVPPLIPSDLRKALGWDDDESSGGKGGA